MTVGAMLHSFSEVTRGVVGIPPYARGGLERQTPVGEALADLDVGANLKAASQLAGHSTSRFAFASLQYIPSSIAGCASERTSHGQTREEVHP